MLFSPLRAILLKSTVLWSNNIIISIKIIMESSVSSFIPSHASSINYMHYVQVWKVFSFGSFADHWRSIEVLSGSCLLLVH